MGVFVRQGRGWLFPPKVRFGDIVRGLPLPDDSVLAVYCSHVLEHIPRDCVPRALANTFRILVPGGTFRLVVPDLEWRAMHYLEAARQSESGAADRCLESLFMGGRQRQRNLSELLRWIFGNSAHLWMYDFPLLSRLLEDAGFARIRRCDFGDAAIAEFSEVEERSRFFEDGKPELAIESIKP